MQSHLRGLFFGVAAAVVLPLLLCAQNPRPQRAPAEVKPAPRLPDGKPDLYGVWTVRGDNRLFGRRTPGSTREQEVTPAEEAMKPEVREQYKAQLAAGKIRTIERDLFDPAIKACAPFGTSRLIQQGRPVEILQIPGRILFRYEQEHMVRDVWMNEREHPKDLVPTWMGHSIGRWDGDTLVVDTVGFNDLTWLDSPGHPHSAALHLTERYARVSQDTLEIQLVVDDPEIYTKPVTSNTLTYRLMPGAQITEWVNCEDRIRLTLDMDVCKITGAWEYEAYCRRREKGLPVDRTPDTSPPGRGY